MVKYIEKKYVKENLPKRVQDSNKSSYGRILNIAGSVYFPGAAYMSSISALKTGAGYVTLSCPDSIINSIASISPEITYLNRNKIMELIDTYNVISIGCGLGINDVSTKLTEDVILTLNENQKIVLDADALNILALYDKKPQIKNSIITPHPKELSRLLNVEIIDILNNREKYARIASQTFDCITVLKGHNTIVTDGDDLYINTTGNSALAKAGSGDVLTGIISAMLAQGSDLINAAILGVFIHGLAGDIASEKLTQYSVLAVDVIDNIPKALSNILFED